MATTEQFSLRWNNFHSNLTNGFHELLEASEMVDVTLAVEGHFFQAHKIVLSICSPYFKQMFKVNPCKHPIVILKDVAHSNMKDILEFMYMGQVNVLRENLSNFLRTAELLQVKGLTGDDSSETSSRKDDKPDSIADQDEDEEEPDLAQYNPPLVDSDVELPPHYSTPTVPTQIQPPVTPNIPPTLTTTKRQSKTSTAANCKRTKTETTPTKPKDACELSSAPDEHDGFPPIKQENNGESEDAKNCYKQMLENNLGPAGSADPNAGDQDVLLYTVDDKGHVFCPYCYRKFVNRYNLKVHIRDKHEDSPIDLNCRICGKVMRNRSCLRVHMYHHRKQQLDAAASVVPLV